MGKIYDLALKNNAIRSLEDAFNEFPGELDDSCNYVINEEYQDYYFKYDVKDIVFVKNYKYNNGNSGNNHLFVIIEDNYAVSLDYLCLLISSNLSKLNYDANKLLLKNNINNLNKDSIVKTDVIYSIKNDDILFKIGKIIDEQYAIYQKSFIQIYSK